MARIQRVAATFIAQIDRVIGTFENHEAVVEAALSKLQSSLRAAQLRLRRVVEDGNKLDVEIERAEGERLRWQERARQVATDKEKAIDCLKRMEGVARDLSVLSVQLKHHRRNEALLRSEITSLEGRVGQLARKRNMLRTQASKIGVSEQLASLERSACSELDHALSQWEEDLCMQDVAPLNSEDPLKEEFERREESERLQRLYQELCKGQQ